MNYPNENGGLPLQPVVPEREVSQPSAFVPQAVPPKKRRWVKPLIIWSVVLITVAAAVVAAVLWGLPYLRYLSAKSAFEAGDYVTAGQEFAALGEFLDSEALTDEVAYEQAKALLSDKDYAAALRAFRRLGDYKDAKEQLLKTKYQQAYDNLEKGYHLLALSQFTELSGITEYKDIAEKAKECRYGYVLTHKQYDDATTLQFLKDLKFRNYKDAAEIYDELYGWKLEGCISPNGGEYTVHHETVSRQADYLHCWFVLSGGEPGATLDLQPSIYYPDGTVEKADWEWKDKGDGDEFGVEWENGLYFYPADGALGTLTVKVCNATTGALVCEVKTEIVG